MSQQEFSSLLDYPLKNLSELKFFEIIGRGTYGKVYKCKDQNTGKYVAYKRIINYDKLDGIPENLIREISAIQRLANSPYVVNMEEFYINKRIGFTMPFYEYSLKNYSKLSKQEIKEIIHQVLKGLRDADQASVCHRDLKPDNILIKRKDGKLNVSICDWGLSNFTLFDSKLLNVKHTGEVQTLLFRAPEIILGDRYYNIKVDMWSLGIILLELVQGSHPCPGDSEIDQLFRFFRLRGTPNEQSWPGVSKYPYFKTTFPKWKPQKFAQMDKIKDDPFLADFLEKILEMDPKKRLDPETALKHPYFKGLVNDLSPCILSNYTLLKISEKSRLSRRCLFDWLIDVIYSISLDFRPLFLAMFIYDQVISNYDVNQNFQIVGCACLLIASKVSSNRSLDPIDLVHISAKAFNVKELIKVERSIIAYLDFNLFRTTVWDHTSRVLRGLIELGQISSPIDLRCKVPYYLLLYQYNYSHLYSIDDQVKSSIICAMDEIDEIDEINEMNVNQEALKFLRNLDHMADQKENKWLHKLKTKKNKLSMIH